MSRSKFRAARISTASRRSIAAVKAKGREPLFDAEHFFDGYKANPDYALDCIRAAQEAGARWLVLCDTNGGTLPEDVYRIVVGGEGKLPGAALGIHAHNDTEQAVAVSLAAVRAGARQVQGTLNGLGERCGNANLCALIPTLLLKEPYASQFETGIIARTIWRASPRFRACWTKSSTARPTVMRLMSGRRPSRIRAGCIPPPC